MKWALKIFVTLGGLLLVSACSEAVDEYESKFSSGVPIDLEMCSIINELEAVDVIAFKDDSLGINDIFDSLVTDTASFLYLSNVNSWQISIDSTCYFILFAPQVADSYYVALNASSEFHLFRSNGTLIDADNSDISLVNIAGCPDIRTRQTYSGLSGAYIARIVNPNVSSLQMVVMNTNIPPSANFSINSNSVFIGDSITFIDESRIGSFSILTYSWEFGDNVINSDSSVVKYTYTDTGYFSPSLTVSDGYLFNSIIKNNYVRVVAGEN